MKPSALLLIAILVSGLVAGCASKQPAPVVDRTKGPAGESAPSAADAKSAAPASDRQTEKGYYVVKPGDTLYRISLDHGQAYKDIASWNALESPYVIRPGQELRILPPDADPQTGVVTRPVAVAKVVEQRTLEDADMVKRGPKAGREPYSDEAYANAMKVQEAPLVRVEIKAEAPRPEPKAVRADGEIDWIWPATGKVVAQFGENGKKGIEFAGQRGDAVLAAADGKVVYSGAALRGYGQLLIVKHDPAYLSVYAHNNKIHVKEQDAVKRGQRIADMGDSEADQVKLYFEIRQQGKQVDPAKLLPGR